MSDIALKPADETARLRAISFLNWAHALDHFVILIFPTVVIGLEVVYGRPYSELIALGTASFVAFGVFSLPAGWLADRWSRRNMMAAFYVGCGASLVAAALAPNLIVLATALFALGVFASIYHPVGMAMLIEAAKVRGRTLAFNGVCGNVGAALAAGISAALAWWLGWRAAFMVPGLICIVTGIAYLALVPDDRHKAGKRDTAADEALPAKAAVAFFVIYIVISICSGLTFNTLSIALPKIVDERLGASISLLAVGGLATAVFLCGALGQIVVGRLVERITPTQLFSLVVGAAAHRHLLVDLRQRPGARGGAGAQHGGDLRAGDGRRPGDGALHRRRLARPRVRGALLPHLRGGGRRRVGDRAAARPRRLRPRARRHGGADGGHLHRRHRHHHPGGERRPPAACGRRRAAGGVVLRLFDPLDQRHGAGRRA